MNQHSFDPIPFLVREQPAKSIFDAKAAPLYQMLGQRAFALQLNGYSEAVPLKLSSGFGRDSMAQPRPAASWWRGGTENPLIRNP